MVPQLVTTRLYSVKEEPWQLWVKEEKVTTNISQQIYLAVHEQDSFTY